MRRYRDMTPRWLEARWAGECSKCGDAIAKGERCFYYPTGKKLLSGECAEAASADYESIRFDEAQYHGEWK